MLNENFYISLKKFFKDQNITQQQVADKLGTSQAYVNSILTGRNHIGRQTASRLAAAYGLSAAWLLTGERQRRQPHQRESHMRAEGLIKDNDKAMTTIKQ